MASARRPFPGGGETGALMRAHDWAASPLGPSEGWPAALHAALNLMLNSPESMYLVWGPELTFFYNDAYRPVLGPRLDGALGRPLPVLWADAWEAVRGPLERALAGTAGRFENVKIAMARRGVEEETWWSYSYSPLYDDDGRIAGVFCVTNETTASVLAERARHRSEARQRRSLQQMPGFVAVLSGPDHVFDYVNDAYVTIAGPRDFIGRSVRAVFPELEGQGFYELLDAVYATGEPFSARAMPIRLTGEESDRAIDLLYQPLRDDLGAVTGIFVGGYDATEQARSTAALRDLNADLERQVTERSRERSLTWQVSPDLLSIIGPDGVFEATNPAWEVTLGWTTEELRTHYGTIVHPDDLETSAAVFRDVIGGLPVLRFENRYRRKAGGYRWLSWVAVPESGRVYCSARDVTEQKAYARTLHLYESIIQSNASPICAFDTEFRLIAFNAAHSDDFYRIYGYRVKVGDIFPDLFLPEQGAVMRGFMARALTGEIFSVVEEFGDPALVKPYWEVSYTPLRDAGGRIIGAFHYASDITERLRAQADLQMAQEALRQSQKMEAVGQLTGGLAHDFNNLLAGISGSLELMQSRMSQGRVAEVQRYVAAAQGAARRAAALTHRLLAFSRRQTLDPRPISVNRLIGGMQEMIQRTVGPAITLEVAAAPDLWPALVDPSQLENALLNLCINARDAMPDGGRITVETANVVLDEGAARARDLAPGPYLSLAVTDTGTGMVPEVIARVFEPFFTTKPLGEGTGLGLSMIYGFAQQSGGQVRLTSEVGRGTAVRLYLPRHEGGVEGGVEDEEDGSDAASLPRAGRGETVLVVDDEPTVRMLVADILDELGYTAIEAADSAAGLRVLQSDVRIDLLVTDVGLPGGMNGRQMADAGRERRPGLKVLFITGYAETAVLGNRHLSPGMAVLTKPFPMETMAARIRAMIEA